MRALFLAMSALVIAGAVSCSNESPPPGVSFYDRGWSDARTDEWTSEYAYRLALLSNREGAPRRPGDGLAVLSRNKAGDRLTQYGYFEKKGDGEVVVVRQQDDKKFELTYRVYDCEHERFDVCADVSGLPEGPKTYYSIKRNKTWQEGTP